MKHKHNNSSDSWIQICTDIIDEIFNKLSQGFSIKLLSEPQLLKANSRGRTWGCHYCPIVVGEMPYFVKKEQVLLFFFLLK